MLLTKTADAMIDREELKQEIALLARDASIEANVHDINVLESCAPLITQGARMYVSHLPNQRWEDTCATSAKVYALGFKPVPHIPVRLIESKDALHSLLDALSAQASIDEILLISGDYPQARGPFLKVAEVLDTFPLKNYGIKKVSLAGHPEGHPRVDLEIIRQAEREKCQLAAKYGYECRLVTQFFFESASFIRWSEEQLELDVPTQRIAGIAGPASIGTLFKFAMRCGVGPSIRALGVRPGSLLKMMGDYTPSDLVVDLARARQSRPELFSGLHVFCFGGLLRTCQWLNTLAQGEFEIDSNGNVKTNR
jgi:methylenetetrahydrofolate reductase (NADPH)